MTSTHAFAPADFDFKSARLDLSRTLQVSIPNMIALLQIGVAVILGLCIARELLIGYVGAGTVLKDLRHFALDAERSIPAWLEGTTMAASSLLLLLIAAVSGKFDTRNQFQWAALAAIFLLMSIDESVSFHEILVAPLRNAFDLSGVFYFSWVLLATPIVIALGLYFTPFLLRLPRQTAIRIIIAGTVFVGGALGTEFACGYLATTAGMESVAYRTTAATQECLETIGMTLFFTALLRHLALIAPSLRLAINN